ncbi:MAG: PqqD family protein [Ramlibacter sp.]
MNLSDKVTIPSQVMTRQVGDETVLLHLGTGTYYGLDSVGQSVWLLMRDGKTLAEICDLLLDEYDVTREALTRDVLELADKLLAQGLITSP